MRSARFIASANEPHLSVARIGGIGYHERALVTPATRVQSHWLLGATRLGRYALQR